MTESFILAVEIRMGSYPHAFKLISHSGWPLDDTISILRGPSFLLFGFAMSRVMHPPRRVGIVHRIRRAVVRGQRPQYGRIVLLIMLMLLSATGCVRRRLNVRTNPPGALVYVDNQQIGTTPCSVDFTYYGTREIRLVKPGYETLTLNQPIPAPWYQVPPLDFVSENLVPTKIRDNRTVTYNLAPQLIVPTPQLLDRANQLRQETLQYPTTPASASVPIGAGAPAPVR
ncbi:MAG: PEGA domain-containing protein [Pirellulales bacterium]